MSSVFGELLFWFYSCTGDYGFAIVCLTVLVKLVLLPLSVRQRKASVSQQAGTGSCLLLLLTLPVLTGLYRTVLSGTGAAVGSRLCPWVISLLSRDPYGILPAMSAAVQPFLFIKTNIARRKSCFLSNLADFHISFSPSRHYCAPDASIMNHKPG